MERGLLSPPEAVPGVGAEGGGEAGTRTLVFQTPLLLPRSVRHRSVHILKIRGEEEEDKATRVHPSLKIRLEPQHGLAQVAKDIPGTDWKFAGSLETWITNKNLRP